MEDQGRFFKQNIARIYTRISREILGIGVKTIKISVYPEFIIILAEQGRSVPMTSLIEGGYPGLTQDLRYALGRIIKERLTEALKEELGLEIKSAYRDYDKGVIATYLEL